jgi:hypothetical protein
MNPAPASRVGQVWSMTFSSPRLAGDFAIVGLVVGWNESPSSAWRMVDLATHCEFHVGERSFEADPWWRRIA